MPFSVRDIGLGFLLPVILTLLLSGLLFRLFRNESARLFVLALSLAAGLVAGYAALHLGPWRPAAHWQWIPYVALITAVTGPLSAATSRPWLRSIWQFGSALIAGWLLVPTWAKLQPSPMMYVLLFAVLVGGLTAGVQPLSCRIGSRPLSAMLLAPTLTTIVLVAAAGSLRFAHIAMALAGATVGCTISLWIRREQCQLAGLLATWTVVSAGLILVSYLNSFGDLTPVSFVLVAVAPLVLWLGVVGPLGRVRQSGRAWVQFVLLLVPLAASLLLIRDSLLNL